MPDFYLKSSSIYQPYDLYGHKKKAIINFILLIQGYKWLNLSSHKTKVLIQAIMSFTAVFFFSAMTTNFKATYLHLERMDFIERMSSEFFRQGF